MYILKCWYPATTTSKRHRDMKVSLTYLRGLEVKQLDVEDLPTL
jgi:hypothetical protein